MHAGLQAVSSQQKRNSTREMDMKHVNDGQDRGGVGVRHGKTSPEGGGGGYPKKCEIFKFSEPPKKRDPRIDELRKMGLQKPWIEVAESIGMDAFLKVWRILDSDMTNVGDDGRLLVPLRAYSSYLKFQRNRYIETLTGLGYRPDEIQKMLKKQLCEEISIRHISRIQTKG